jgi:hypothetical protein
MWMLLLSLALAGVPDETWLAVEGQKVVLVNPEGKQIRGTVVGYEGDRVKLERESDGRMVVVLKHEVSSVILVEQPVEAEPEPEDEADDLSVKGALLEAGGIVKEVGGDVLDDVRPIEDEVDAEEPEPESEVVETGPVLTVPPVEETVITDTVISDTVISDTVISDTVISDTVVGEPVEDAPILDTVVVTVDEPEGPEEELSPDGPVIIDTVIVSEPAAPIPAELTTSPIPVGRSYDDGLRAGRSDAADAGTLGAFAGGFCGTAVATAVPCAFSPILGCATGAVAGTAAPAAAYLLEPTPDYSALPDGEGEYSRGYVEGYTRELRRRRLVMAAIGSGSGLAVGGLTGLVIYGQL